MKIIDALGHVFSSEIENAGSIQSVEGDEGHGEYTSHVSSRCGCWECILGANGLVETIFFYAKPKCYLPFGIESHMTPSDVIGLLGDPTKQGSAFEDEILGKLGGWIRFDQPDKCIHIQFVYDASSVAQVTLMLPHRAP